MTTDIHHHEEKHLKSSNFITDVVIGMADGLTVPFALAAGLSGAVSSNGIIITAGLAEIVAGSIAMGLGGYLAGQTEVEHYESELKREYDEVDRVPEREKEEIRDILAEYGISQPVQVNVVDELAQDKHKWVDFMMKFELGLEKPDGSRARKSAFTIGLSYVVGGLVPLMGYIFTSTPNEGLISSTILTTICLFIFGYFKSQATQQPRLAGALKLTVIGLLAASGAYLIARLVGG